MNTYNQRPIKVSVVHLPIKNNNQVIKLTVLDIDLSTNKLTISIEGLHYTWMINIPKPYKYSWEKDTTYICKYTRAFGNGKNSNVLQGFIAPL